MTPTTETLREAMRKMGEQPDPTREALRRMIAEFGDQHYHTCPADNDSGPCDCFAGHLVVDACAALASPSIEGQDLHDVKVLLQAICDLVDDEEIAEPLDCAIAHANKALSIILGEHPKVAAVSSQDCWQHISIAPKDGTIFIAKDSDGVVFRCQWQQDDYGHAWYSVDGDQLGYPVRWIPMPDALPLAFAATLPVADRAAVIEELAQDFESSVHHVWDKDEVADRIRKFVTAKVEGGR